MAHEDGIHGIINPVMLARIQTQDSGDEDGQSRRDPSRMGGDIGTAERAGFPPTNQACIGFKANNEACKAAVFSPA